MVVGRTMSRVTVSTVNSEGYGRTLTGDTGGETPGGRLAEVRERR